MQTVRIWPINEYLLMCSPGSSSYKQISVCIKPQLILSGRIVNARLQQVIKQEQGNSNYTKLIVYQF